MPKRPCTITLDPDESKIICGDKFGDVYSLPLLGTVYENAKAEATEKADEDNTESSKTAFTPAANSRTVHTKKNMEALRNQQKQIKQKAEKQVLQFEHQLLLGHVSLLTDLAYVRLNDEHSPSSRTREYIITSDRDEHIRVSRGIPQAHIIEGYCLGHEEFVSAVCTLQRHPQLLVSGGGDDYLIVWDWLSGNIKQKVDLREHVEEVMRLAGAPEVAKINIAVTGIWDASSEGSLSHGVAMVVTCEAYVSACPILSGFIC